MDKVTTRQDRIAGLALLALGIVVMFVPDFQLAGQTVKMPLMAAVWFPAAIVMLTMDSAARPNPKLVRRGAAILFVAGLAAPFFVILIDQSLGA